MFCIVPLVVYLPMSFPALNLAVSRTHADCRPRSLSTKSRRSHSTRSSSIALPMKALPTTTMLVCPHARSTAVARKFCCCPSPRKALFPSQYMLTALKPFAAVGKHSEIISTLPAMRAPSLPLRKSATLEGSMPLACKSFATAFSRSSWLMSDVNALSALMRSASCSSPPLLLASSCTTGFVSSAGIRMYLNDMPCGDSDAIWARLGEQTV
mmetsp:Transcript_34738/g.76619  ORF Transcript_34738/g.76619 Transcript_34738/m.76619 type:complete len:211 (+) Transcript_34738:772-1404(+)